MFTCSTTTHYKASQVWRGSCNYDKNPSKNWANNKCDEDIDWHEPPTHSIKFTSKYYNSDTKRESGKLWHWLNELMQWLECNSQLKHALARYCFSKVGGHKGWIEYIKYYLLNKTKKKKNKKKPTKKLSSAFNNQNVCLTISTAWFDNA